MTWDAFNRRKDVLHTIMDVADRRRDGNDLYDEIPEVREAYETRDDLLVDLQMAWFQAFSGQVDSKLYFVHATPEDLVLDAWATAAGFMPGTRAILDANEDNPALQKAFAKEAEAIAVALGMPRGAIHAESLGRRVRGLAQAQPIKTAEIAATPSAGIFARIREAFAA